jgi:hypothetical protein
VEFEKEMILLVSGDYEKDISLYKMNQIKPNTKISKTSKDFYKTLT